MTAMTHLSTENRSTNERFCCERMTRYFSPKPQFSPLDLDRELRERAKAAKERMMERKNHNNPSPKGFDAAQDDDYSSYFRKKKQSSNPFDDDEPGVDTNKSSGTPGRRVNPSSTLPYDDSTEEKLLSPQELYQRERLKIQDRTLQSTQKSIGLIHESEAVGAAAAQELVHQRTQLENTNKTLDEMNSTLDQSQRHINNIKSVFGGIKNWWTSKPANSTPSSPVSGTDKLKPFVESQGSAAPKPHASHSNFGTVGDSDFARPAAPVKTVPQSSKDFDHVLDNNLDSMSLGLSRLKGLAEGLGEEINQQNRLLDDMNRKTDNVGGKMSDQQKSLDKLLGKKK